MAAAAVELRYSGLGSSVAQCNTKSRSGHLQTAMNFPRIFHRRPKPQPNSVRIAFV